MYNESKSRVCMWFRLKATPDVTTSYVGMWNKQKNIKLSGDDVWHKNSTEECANKTVIPKENTMLIHTALSFPEETFPLNFGQCK